MSLLYFSRIGTILIFLEYNGSKMLYLAKNNASKFIMLKHDLSQLHLNLASMQKCQPIWDETGRDNSQNSSRK